MTGRPNFLFLIAHDISLRFGCYGDPRAATPNIDALAAGGSLFENAFCQFPMCAPARTCLMTGCRPDTVQRFDIGGADFYAGLRRRLPWIRTLPELLRAAGYRTTSLQKVLHEYETDPPSWSEPPWFAATGEVPAWCPDDFDCRERARRYRAAANRSLMEARFRLLQAEELRRGHYAAVSYLDAQIGRILAALDETGLAGNTVVVFTTDHGFALGEHRHWGKGMPWEPDLRVPLLLRAPHAGSGQHVTALTVLPTLLEQAGVKPPAWAEGSSLMPLLRNPAAPAKQAVISQAARGGLKAYSARTPHHRYTRWLDAAGHLHAEELYDPSTRR